MPKPDYICPVFKIDVTPAIRTIENSVGRLSPRLLTVAVARALNHTAAKAQTAVSREIRKVYNIKARDVRKAMRRSRARATHLEARIDLSGAPLPLLAFGARATKTGVSVAIKLGERKRIERAFVQKMPSGHEGVFARGGYQRGQFQFRTKRIARGGNDLPIAELTSLAIPQALANAQVMDSIARGIERDMPARLQHELQRLIAGLPPGSEDAPSLGDLLG